MDRNVAHKTGDCEVVKIYDKFRNREEILYKL